MNLGQKNIALLLGMILLGWIAYHLSFSKTMALQKQYSDLIKEKELFSNVSEKLLRLNRQNNYYDSILKSKKISTGSSFQNILLQTITTFADSTHIKIVRFDSPHIFKTENTIIKTYLFTFDGSYANIIRLLYELEYRYKLGKILSVNFEKKKNYRSNISYLEGTVLLQRIDSQ